MQSTLLISANDSMSRDSGPYYCQVISTVNETDNFTAYDTSIVSLTGKHMRLIKIVSLKYSFLKLFVIII